MEDYYLHAPLSLLITMINVTFRASTEFTGWPSPSTTPFSIEKLLEAQRNATATTPFSINTEATTHRRTTTTTTTTVAPPPPTTPGVCRHECDIAATIKIVAGNRIFIT